jgi:hypothetical protein
MENASYAENAIMYLPAYGVKLCLGRRDVLIYFSKKLLTHLTFPGFFPTHCRVR